MSVVVENEWEVPVTVTERDWIAAAAPEGGLPTLEACATVQAHRAEFCKSLDWAGIGKDTERQVASPKEGYAIVVVIHRVPRFAACGPEELSEAWRNQTPSLGSLH